MTNPRQLKCPSCGATLSQSFPNQLIILCPYCHQQVVNNTYHSFCKNEEPRILEFSMSEKDVVKLMVDMLIEDQNVPTDIFDKMKISSISKYYVPMYIFEGTYRAPWTAKVERKEQRQRIGSDGKIENYYETLYDYPCGEAAGNFSINSISTKEIDELGLDNEHLQMFSVNYASLPLLSATNLEDKDIKIFEPASSSEAVWFERGKAEALRKGSNEAYSSANGIITSCSVSCELKKTSFVYISIWIIKYEYLEKLYTYHLYGEKVNTLSRPYADLIQAQPTEEQQNVLNTHRKRDVLLSNIRNIGCLSIIMIGFIGSWDVIKYIYTHPYGSEYSGEFGWKMFFLGIAYLILIKVMRIIYKYSDGINNIEKDIVNRTRVLHEKILENKTKSGDIFIKQFYGQPTMSFVEPEMNYCSNDIKESPQENIMSPSFDVPPRIKKFCSHCGKEIGESYKFCRYCGTKL